MSLTPSCPKFIFNKYRKPVFLYSLLNRVFCSLFIRIAVFKHLMMKQGFTYWKFLSIWRSICAHRWFFGSLSPEQDSASPPANPMLVNKQAMVGCEDPRYPGVGDPQTLFSSVWGFQFQTWSDLGVHGMLVSELRSYNRCPNCWAISPAPVIIFYIWVTFKM